MPPKVTSGPKKGKLPAPTAADKAIAIAQAALKRKNKVATAKAAKAAAAALLAQEPAGTNGEEVPFPPPGGPPAQPDDEHHSDEGIAQHPTGDQPAGPSTWSRNEPSLQSSCRRRYSPRTT